MEKRVVILNGPIGVGKTTVGKLLSEALPPSAFLDGDWCFDLHPFVANRETRAMAADNIIHILQNYLLCPYCKTVIFAWVMQKAEIYDRIVRSVKQPGVDVIEITLTCTREALQERWYKDKLCDWRTEEWLEASLGSLGDFLNLQAIQVDTSRMTALEAAREIIDIVGGKEP